MFFQWTTREAEVRHNYAVLREGYGMMIFCESRFPEQPYPTPRFKLFAHDHGMIVETTDMAELKEAITRIRAGETIRLFNTCAGGTHNGIDPRVLRDINEFCQRCRITYRDDTDGVICICP